MASALFGLHINRRAERQGNLVISSQARSLYRYGEMATCSPKLEEFKFCMSLKGMHPEEKRDVWIRRRAEWWARRRAQKSSEDVWDART